MFLVVVIVDDFYDILVLFAGVTIPWDIMIHKTSRLSIIAGFGACFLLPRAEVLGVGRKQGPGDFRTGGVRFLAISR